MVKEKMQLIDEFDKHWIVSQFTEISESKLHEARVFFNPIESMLKTEDLLVLDVGSGDGVHWICLRDYDNKDLNYMGIDISSVSLQRIKEQVSGNFDNLVQMDAINLAARNNIFDVVFSFGVVAYTSDPKKCFVDLCRVCKPGGWVGIWVYPQKRGLVGIVFNLTRKLCQRVGYFWTRRIADMIIPFLGFLPTRSKVSLRNSTWHQCREVVLVNIAPSQLMFYKRNEIMSWFEANNIEIQFEDHNNPITIWGRKK